MLYSKVSLSLIIRRYVRKTQRTVNINKLYKRYFKKQRAFIFYTSAFPLPLSLVGEGRGEGGQSPFPFFSPIKEGGKKENG
jgi:hypothetical protein